MLRRVLVGHPFNPSDSGRSSQRRITEIRGQPWIRAMSQEELQQINVAGLSCANEGGCSGLEEPLHRKYRASQCVVLHAGIWVRAVLKQSFDVFEVVHIRLRYGEITAFDIPVVRRQIKWRPATFVGPV